jgi:hypothetical protein
MYADIFGFGWIGAFLMWEIQIIANFRRTIVTLLCRRIVFRRKEINPSTCYPVVGVSPDLGDISPRTTALGVESSSLESQTPLKPTTDFRARSYGWRA